MSDGMKRAFAATKATRQDTGPKLGEIAERITAHLQRFEADPAINVETLVGGMKLTPYYKAFAVASGSRVMVKNVSYQCHTNLTKADALAYLAWLDAGNVGTLVDWRRAVKGAT